MTQLDKAFELFKENPSGDNVASLLSAIVEYQKMSKKEGLKHKTPTLKTKKGGKWNIFFSEIQELFTTFEWVVSPYKSNEYVEAWKVTYKNDQAILFLTSNGFSMGSKNPDEKLKGEFAGYEDQERFYDFLVSNGIEVDF